MSDGETRWSVALSPTAVQQIQRLPRAAASAITQFVTVTICSDPVPLAQPLSYELSGWHTARRGDYRVILRVLDDNHTILIGRIEHRAHTYR